MISVIYLEVDLEVIRDELQRSKGLSHGLLGLDDLTRPRSNRLTLQHRLSLTGLLGLLHDLSTLVNTLQVVLLAPTPPSMLHTHMNTLVQELSPDLLGEDD